MLQISACAWALTSPPVNSLDRIRLAGFDRVDIRPDCWDGIGDACAITSRGLTLGCFGLLGGPLPGALSIDDIAGYQAQPVLDYLCGVIDRAGALGADRAYMITPSRYPADDARYLSSIATLADRAASAGMKLCLEPTPGRSLPNDASCLEFVRKTGHENVHVLVDFGHCLITGENPSDSIRKAGTRLGYVHIDDNHGVTDDHVALFDGVLKAPVMDEFLATLGELPYDGGLGIEFKTTTPSPMSALVQARDYIREWELRHGVFG